MKTRVCVKSLGLMFRSVLVAGIFSCYTSLSVLAAPMNGDAFTFTQPDGTVITLKMFGDEFYARTETEDGYTVIFDHATMSYDYANVSPDRKKLVPSGMKVGKGNPKALGVPRRLDIDPEERRAITKARFKRWDDATGNSKRWAEIKKGMQEQDAKALLGPQQAEGVDGSTVEGPSLAPPTFTTTGNKLGLTMLIDFTDDTNTISQAEIINFCNADNYTGYSNNGSVKKYFQDCSGGLLTYSNVVTVYIRMVQPKTYYNVLTADAGDQANILIKDALDIMKALPNYASEILPTFNNLTVDGSNRAVAFNVFYAGAAPANEYWSLGLWPHSWSLYNVGAQALGNGKSVYKYQLTNIGSSLSIGTFCHENGHMLCGFPDIYDYDNAPNNSVGGAGVFCLMNSGAYSKTPVLPCAYLRRAAGWCTTTDFNSTTNFTASLSTTNFNKIYRYPNPAAPTTEYFLFENRQKTGRDANIAASGIAIWHIDHLGDRDNESRIRNTSHANYECTLIQADNLWHFNNDVNNGDSNDLYYMGNSATGYANVFNDTTGPDANWWSGASSGLWAYNFSAAATTMTFQVGLQTNTVSVLSPNGGETVYCNSIQSITWAANVVGNLKIELLKDGVVYGVLSASEPNDGSYQWTVPSDLVLTNTYTIKVSSVETGAYDLSNAAFSIVANPLAEAVDAVDLPWSSSGNAAWFKQTVTTHDSVDAAQSGDIADDQFSSVETTLTGPGTLTFWWKVSSESGYDFLIFYLNDVEQTGALAKIAGTVNWVQKTVSIPAGTNSLKWSYVKDESVSSGSDAAWLDQVVWTPSNTTSLTVSPATTFSASGSYGGPFSPASQAYVLTNSGGASLNWTAGKSATWLNLSSASGSLAAGASTTVTVSIATSANTLTSGVYNATVAFTNTTNGSGNTTRNVTLTVNKLPATVTLGNLSQVYTGTARPVSTTTAPTGLVVNVTYAGSSVAPTNAGSYAVVATISEPLYQGGTNGTLVVDKAIPSVTNWPTATSIDVGQALSNAVLGGGSSGVPGAFVYVTPTNRPPVGVYTAAVTFVASDSGNYASVTGSVVITVVNIYIVPFLETFEARSVDTLHDQHGWVADGTVVQTNTVFAGAKAAQIAGSGGYLKHAFTDGRTKVWMDLRVQVVQSPEKPTPEVDATVAVYVSTNSIVWAFDGTNALSTGVSVIQGTNVWNRFTTFSDYAAKKYILYVNDVRVGKYGFYNAAVTNFTEVKISGDATFVDNIEITPNQPAMKYMPSLILLQ